MVRIGVGDPGGRSVLLGAFDTGGEHRFGLVDELVWIKGFGHPVVGTGLHDPLDVFLVGVARDIHDADVLSLGIGADELADPKAVDIRHHQVEDDEVGAKFDDLKTRFKSIGGGA